MEFIQKKTADRAVEHFLAKAAEEEISLVWDRFEGQLPECGFCEAGLSCRDCLQGPCISHPFRDSSKAGVCGKDKDTSGRPIAAEAGGERDDGHFGSGQ